MSQALQHLLDLLDLEQIEENIFRGRSRSAVVPRVFGGQVAAQALVAAGRTVPACRLVAVMLGKPIFHHSASFQTYEDGLDHQAPMPPSPDPATLPTAEERLRGYAHLDPEVVERSLAASAAVDLRYVDEPP